jgi:chromosome segregation ATPase
MQLRKLTVKNFRNIGYAQVDFGPRLNVLYGPNELGKSGLAEAIRAAFLVRPGSAAAYHFIPWGTQLVPEVVVEFETGRGDPNEENDNVEKNGSDTSSDSTQVKTAVTWRLTKEFSRGGKASLHRLPASGGSILEAEGRDVEENLHALLEWGIKPPGGRRGGGRGMPNSYLTTALLGRQDGVEEIFSAELTGDKHESGREALTQALGALGQNPLVGAVLGKLEKELQPVFSEKSGQQRRGQDSPIVQMTEKVKAQEQVVLELKRLRNESQATQERFETARERQQELIDQGKLLQESSTYWQSMQLALVAVKNACEHSSHMERLQVQLGGLRLQLQDAERLHKAAKETLKECEGSLSEAKLQQVAAQTKLEQLRHSRDQSESASREKHEANRSRCEQTLQQANQLKQAIATRSDLEQQRSELSRQLKTEQTEMARAERLLDVSRLVEQLRKEQANAKDFEESHERCLQTKIAHQQQLAELNRVKQDLATAERDLEECREKLQAAKESLAETSQSSGARATHRSSLENKLRNTQNQYRLVKQLEDKRLQFDGNRRSVEELQEQKSQLDQAIENAETNELAARSAAGRWRMGLVAAAVLLVAGLTLGVASSEQQIAGFIIAGVGAAGAVATFVVLGRHLSGAKAATAEKVAHSETRRDASSRLFLAESNLTLAERGFENASSECEEFLSDGLISLEEVLGRTKTAKAKLEEFDTETPDELLTQRTGEVAAIEFAAETTRERIRELKLEGDRCQNKVGEHHAELITAQTKTESLKRLSDDDLSGLATRIATEREELDLDDESEIANLTVAAGSFQEIKEAVEELQGKVKIVNARREDSNKANRIAELVATVAQAIDEDVCEQFKRGPDEESLTRIVEHIESKKNEIDHRIGSVSNETDGEIRKTESEISETEKLIGKRQDDCLKVSARADEATRKLNELKGQCEVKQHELDQQSRQGDPQQHLSECTELYNGALSQWQRYSGQFDDGQLACLRAAQLPDSPQLLVFEVLLAGLRLGTDSNFQSNAGSTSTHAQVDDQLKHFDHAVELMARHLKTNQSDATEAAKFRYTLEGELQKVVGPAIEEELAQGQEELNRLQTQSQELEDDFDAWKHLRDSLLKVDARNSAHLGRQLAQPVQQAFLELTENRYGELILSPEMSLDAITARGDSRRPEEMSVGTRDQLATLIRLTLAAQLQSVLVLDDQLAHSDTDRMEWFRQRLRNSSIDNQHQIVVITCRCEDYVDQPQHEGVTVIDMADRIRPIDIEGES